MKTKTKHVHEYIDGKSKKVAVCLCGAFKHVNLDPADVITEVRGHAPISRLRTEIELQDGNRDQLVMDIEAVVNSHDGLIKQQDALQAIIDRLCDEKTALLEAAKFAFKNLTPKGDVKKDYSGHLAKATLSKAIERAEGK